MHLHVVTTILMLLEIILWVPGVPASALPLIDTTRPGHEETGLGVFDGTLPLAHAAAHQDNSSDPSSYALVVPYKLPFAREDPDEASPHEKRYNCDGSIYCYDRAFVDIQRNFRIWAEENAARDPNETDVLFPQDHIFCWQQQLRKMPLWAKEKPWGQCAFTQHGAWPIPMSWVLKGLEIMDRCRGCGSVSLQEISKKMKMGETRRPSVNSKGERIGGILTINYVATVAGCGRGRCTPTLRYPKRPPFNGDWKEMEVW